jgi:nitroreductase
MNETLKSIFERNSCRDFSGKPLTDTEIDCIVKAALAAPSGMNMQPWHVTVVTDKALIDEMDDRSMEIIAAYDDKSMYERFMSRGGRMFYNAPCMFVITSENPSGSALDCGIMTQNISLAAHSLGFGNVICGMAGIILGDDKYKRRLNFPDGHGFSMAVLIGEANKGKEPHELDMNKVTYIK